MSFKLVLVIASILCALIQSTRGQQQRTEQLTDPNLKVQIQFKTPLTKCCETPSPFYSLGFDSCRAGDMPELWPPPVNSLLTNRTVDVSRIEFILSTNLSTCPPGYMSNSSTDFRLYTDGTVKLSDGTQLRPDDFCLNQIAEEPTIREVDFAVRYCVPDPCNDTNCVRKCCPMGMAVNESSKLCQSSKEPFKFDFQETSGQIVTPDPDSYILLYGDAPACPYGMYALMPEENTEENFYILPNGEIFVTGYPKDENTLREYCFDDFLIDNGVILRRALLCFPPQPEESLDNQLVLQVFPYFLFLSSIFLIATFIVYAIIPEIRNIHGVTIMCHVASLSVTYIGLGFIQLNTMMSDGLCEGLATVVHFAFLSTFTWLNVMSFDIWWTFSPLNKSINAKAEAIKFWMQTLAIETNASIFSVRRQHRNPSTDDDNPAEHSEDSDLISNCDLRPRNSRHGRQRLGRRIIFYSIYAWGVPFVIVLVGQILDHVKNLPEHIIKPGFGEVKCWFDDKGSFLVYLYGPIAVLILSNIVFFIMTAVLLYRASIDAAFAVNSAHAKQKFRVIFSLFILMGVSWMMEVISFAVGGSAYIWIPTDILNILTGVFIFVIFVCKPNVWKLLKTKCPCLEGLDRCCPSFMKRSNTRQGTTTRSTPNEVSVTKSLNNQVGGGNNHDDHKKRISMATATQSTQMRDSTQIDSGDEMMLEHESSRMN